MDATRSDLVWLLPLTLGALLLLASAFAWWRVGNGRVVAGQRVKPGEGDLRQAATVSAFAFGLLAIALLALLWVQL